MLKIMTGFLPMILFAVLSPACNVESDPDRIVGRYKILRLNYDSVRTVSLVKEFGEHSSGSGEEVPPNVIAVGNNDEFIIVKQQPTAGNEGGYKPDTTKTNYYIIDMKNKYKGFLEMTIGPLSRKSFDSLRTIFKIEAIAFDKQY